MAHKIAWLSPLEVRACLDNPQTPMIEHLVASIFAKGVQEGSPAHLNFLLDRLIGKVSEKVKHENLRPFVMELLDGSQIVMGHRSEDEEE